MPVMTRDEELLIEHLAMENLRARRAEQALRDILNALDGITELERYECWPIQERLNKIADLAREGLRA